MKVFLCVCVCVCVCVGGCLDSCLDLCGSSDQSGHNSSIMNVNPKCVCVCVCFSRADLVKMIMMSNNQESVETKSSEEQH